MSDIESNAEELNEQELDDQVEEIIEEEEKLREAMQSFEAPAGMGNTMDMAENDPPEVQQMSDEWQQKLQEMKSREEQYKELASDYLETRQEPQSDIVGVAEQWARSRGTEAEMFSEADPMQVENLKQEMNELKEEMDNLSEKIEDARREHYGYPRS
ncbi:MAG: hypothetical protein ACQESR_03955 [Planctomycetota bacterium]